MAGDWIKMSVGLRSNPKVVRMASALKADRLRVIGGLWAVWCVFDQHSSDGDLPGYTLQVMDEEIGWKGFSQAMHAVEWLEITESGIAVPRFDEHNGASAKRRAQDTQRKRTSRSQPDECPQDKRTETGQTSASQASKTVTREEKRREEKENPPTPRGGGEPDGFAEFWTRYPRKTAKPRALKAFRAAKLNGHLPDVLADLDNRMSGEWSGKEPQFIPHPATYLNDRRWEDSQAGPTAQQVAFV